MADKKVSELSAITNLSGDDLLLVVNDPSGTPASRKVTVSNLFANVVPSTVHKGLLTARANTTILGNSLDVAANAAFSGGVTFNSSVDFTQLSIANTVVIGTNGKLHANNTISPDTVTLSMINGIDGYMQVANTNTLVNDRMQVANTNTLVNDRMQVANTNTLVNDRLQVANATAIYVTNTAFQSFVANTNSRFTSPIHATFNVAANGTSAYVFTGAGTANTDNETIYLYKGFTYEFVNTTGNSHPFQILNSANGTAFANGVSGDQDGTQLFTVPHAQQSNLVYQCSIHSGMQGTLVIVT